MICLDKEKDSVHSGKNNTITYSLSTTIALTHACFNRCLYCNFRKEGGGLLQFEEIRKTAEWARKDKRSEVLVISGENADQVVSVRRDLRLLGLDSMVQWTKRVCEYILEQDLLPHVNIGVLDFSGLNELKEVSASMGLMMEGDYGSLGYRIHPQKSFSMRIQNLEWAGLLKIPFTTGILFGLGETQEDRIRSLQAIINCYRTYRHVQEIILQNFVPNRSNSCIPIREVSKEEIKEMIELCKEEMPDVSLQVPPNLNSKWRELLDLGINDLGGISENGDLVNPENPWPSIREIVRILNDKNYHLKKRLPIYPNYYQRGWYSKEVGRVIEKWIRSGNEYQYYTQGCCTR